MSRTLALLFESLPLIIGLSLTFAINGFSKLPTGMCVGIGFFCGIFACLLQNKASPKILIKEMFSHKCISILRILIGIYIFKGVIIKCQMFAGVGSIIGDNIVILFVMCATISLLAGMLTGILVGAGGIAFPIMTQCLHDAGLWDDRMPWMVLCIMMCCAGQMISPVHVCIVVTAEYFETGLNPLLKKLLCPTLLLVAGAILLSIFLIYIL